MTTKEKKYYMVSYPFNILIEAEGEKEMKYIANKLLSNTKLNFINPYKKKSDNDK